MTPPDGLIPALLGVAVLVVLTLAVLTVYKVAARFAPAWAILRGAVQLAAISLVLSGIITNGLLVGLALLVMFTVATATAARRLRRDWQMFGYVCSAMGAGVATTLAVVFATGAIEFSPRYALAIGGIVIGNAMSITTLAGRNFNYTAIARWEEVEGWLALGARPRQATAELARDAVHSALIPTTDQSKTTGLVTLPGAFVGAIFGGISPLSAGLFQIVVLAAIMAAGTITAVVIVVFLAPLPVRPLPVG
ncbi:ABC transporter permease [Arthrobacter sp. 1P04PC]|uniref:ABC transporter permease n=1 Tax=unclassified Arthrobacter TaxID=235627 RepID=UPI00399F21B8